MAAANHGPLGMEDVRDFYPVVIIGAGASRIAMGFQLKEQVGLEDFIIFDRQSGIGGSYVM